MCTLIIHYAPDTDWPLLLAGNRDEMRDRPWQPPARHWPERPDIRAGLDELGGGTWFGVADHGLVASVLNRQGTLGPAVQRHSRGELVLDALDHGSAAEAARALADLNPQAYRGFNLVVGDPQSVYWIRHADDDSNTIQVAEIPPGLHMIAAGDLDDTQTTRIARWLPQWQAAALPDPAQQHWGDWPALLGRRDHADNEPAHAAMNVDYEGRFGTVCSQLVAIPRYPGYGAAIQFLFAAGAPDQAGFEPVAE